MIGNEFDLALLQEASGIPPAQRARVARRGGGPCHHRRSGRTAEPYRFTHAIIAEALRTELGVTARAQVHQQIAAALERVHANDLAPLAQLAHHCIQALPIGSAQKAVEYSRRGAARARSQLAFAEAVRLCGMTLRALDATPQPDEVQRCQTLLAMGEAQAQGGSLDEARQRSSRPRRSRAGSVAPALLAETALQTSAWFDTFFTLDRALIALVEEALGALDPHDSALRALTHGDAGARALLGRAARIRAGRCPIRRSRWRAASVIGARSCPRSGSPARFAGGRRTSRAGSPPPPRSPRWRKRSATINARCARARCGSRLCSRSATSREREAETRAYAILARRAGEQFGIVERFHAALALLQGRLRARRTSGAGAVEARAAPAGSRPPGVRAGAYDRLAGTSRGGSNRTDVAQTASSMIAQSPALAVQYRVIMAFAEHHVRAAGGSSGGARVPRARPAAPRSRAIGTGWTTCAACRSSAWRCATCNTRRSSTSSCCPTPIATSRPAGAKSRADRPQCTWGPWRDCSAGSMTRRPISTGRSPSMRGWGRGRRSPGRSSSTRA